MLANPEGAEAVIGTLEKVEAVVRTPEGAGDVVEPPEEAVLRRTVSALLGALMILT